MVRSARDPARAEAPARHRSDHLAAGFVLLALPGIRGRYATTFLPGVIVLGLGMAVWSPPSQRRSSARSPRAGWGSRRESTTPSRAPARLLAIAALGLVLTAVFNGASIDIAARSP
jgi:hypothetical protein